MLRATQSEAGRIRRWRQADTEEEAGAAAYAGFIYAGFMSQHLTHGLGPVSSKPLSLGPTTSYLGHNDMHGAAQAAFQAGPTVTMQRLGVDDLKEMVVAEAIIAGGNTRGKFEPAHAR